jgi:acyl-CoA synthetase (AMP-forming)/AMP-acid ligase II
VRCYVQRPRTLDAMFRTAVADHPEAEALVDGSTRFTYRELDRRVDRLAAGLATRGVAHGDRVAMMLANRLEAVIVVLAVARLGAAVVLIGTRLRRPEAEYIVADSQASALLYESSFEGELPSRERAPASEMRFCVDSAAFEALFADRPPAVAVIGEEEARGLDRRIRAREDTGRVEEGAHLVELELRIENQLGEVTTEGSSIVELPTRPR